MSVLSFVLLSFTLFCFANAAPRLVPIGPGFWNVRAPFKVNISNITLEIGTQMSLVKLRTGRFILIDTVDVDQQLRAEIDGLTKNGTLIDAILATHPFHTTYFPVFYNIYPKVAFYGTPRHLRLQPQIPWRGSLWDCANRQKWLPELHMRIPRGAEFTAPIPESSNHFTCIHVFHEASRTLHVDDTVTYNVPFSGNMLFHPSLLTDGLYKIPESPDTFRDWMQKLIVDWNFDNICAAHNGVKIGGARSQLQGLLDDSDLVFVALITRFSLFPNATDAAAFRAMNVHESQCKE